jgi:hypothetical protein
LQHENAMIVRQLGVCVLQESLSTLELMTKVPPKYY